MAKSAQEHLAAALAKAQANGTAPPPSPNGPSQPAAKPAAPKRKPRRVPAWKPFPLEHLPVPLRRLCEEGSAAMLCDPSYIALPGLSVLASAIGGSRVVELKSDWSEPPILWTVVVGDSGTLKTPAYRLAVRPVHEIERERRTIHDTAIASWDDKVAEWKAAGRQGDEPTKPATLQRARVSDITVERLADLLHENPRGLLVARDELAGWFGSFMKYKAAGAGSDVPNWLEMHQGNSITVDRKTGDRRSIWVERAVVSVMGGIQPPTLARALKDEHFDSGLVARLLLAWPPRKRKQWTENVVSVAVRDTWEECVRRLFGFDLFGSPAKRVPRGIALDADAKAMWVEWYAVWAEKQDGAEGEMAAALSKLEAAAGRLALVHHCSSHAAAETEDHFFKIGTRSMEAGTALASWFADEAMRVYAMAKADEGERGAMRLVEWIRRRGGSATARDLHKANKSRYPDSESAGAALDALAGSGLGEWQEVASDGKGGRPTAKFVLDDVEAYPDTPKPRNPSTAAENAEEDNRGDADDAGFGVNGPVGGSGEATSF